MPPDISTQLYQPSAPPTDGQTTPPPANIQPDGGLLGHAALGALAASAQSNAGATPAPASPVKMMNPSGAVGDVNPDKVDDAAKAGYERAVQLVNPSGETGWVRQSKVQDAIKAGYKTTSDFAAQQNHDTNVMAIDDAVDAATKLSPYMSPEAEQAVAGVVKGLYQSGHGIVKLGAEALNKLGIHTDTIDALAQGKTSALTDAMSRGTSPEQKIGEGIETVGEFLTGDEALKGISLADKYKLASKVADIAESSPRLAKAITIGMNALRTGTVGAVQGAAKTGSLGEGLKEGAETAATAGVLEGALANPGESVSAAQAAKEATSKAAGKVGNTVKAITQGEKLAQEPAQAALRTAAGAPDSESSLRGVLQQPISDTMGRAKSLYKKFDDAAGVNYRELQQKLSDTEWKIKQAVDTDTEARLTDARNQIADKIETAKQAAQAKGVDPSVLDQADQHFKQASALQDLQKKLFNNPSVIAGDVTKGAPESVNVDSAIKTLQRLDQPTKYGSSRLVQALGSRKAADQLLSDLYNAQKAGTSAMGTQELAKTIGKYIGVGVGGGIVAGVGYGIGHKIINGLGK